MIKRSYFQRTKKIVFLKIRYPYKQRASDLFVWFACTNFGFGKEKRGRKKGKRKEKKRRRKEKEGVHTFFFVRTPSLVVL